MAGNTFERTPGNRARDVQVVPLDTVHGTLDRALVIPNRIHNVPRVAGEEPSPPVMTGGTLGIVPLQNHGEVYDAEHHPAGTMRAGGFHHGLIVRNNNNPGGDSGSMVTSDMGPVHTIATRGAQSVLIPYNRTGVPGLAELEAVPTISTKDRVAVVVPPTLTQETQEPPREWSEREIGECRFRMFAIPEIAEVMQMHEHFDGGEYEVKGNKREQMAQYGNAVTPPAMELLVSRLTEVL